MKNLPAILNNVPHDYVLIFENGQRTQIETLIPLGVRSDKLIFALDVESWLNHFDVASYILKSDSKSFLTIDFHHLRLKNPIFMYNVPCHRGGVISYINSNNDITVMYDMYVNKRNFALWEIEAFYKLANNTILINKKTDYSWT